MVCLRWATKLLVAVSYLVLGNILGRANWGLLEIAVLILSALSVMTQTGFQSALIQRRGGDGGYFNTAWSIEVIRGALLCLALFLLAPWAVRFFDHGGTFDATQLQDAGPWMVTLSESKDPISVYVEENLSESVRDQFRKYKPGSTLSTEFRESFAGDLNRILEMPGFLNPDRLSALRLSTYTQRLLEQPAADRIRLNRRILQEAYPGLVQERVIDRTTVTHVVRMMALTLLIGALMNIGTVYFKKDLEFHRDFTLSILSILAETILTVFLAYVTRSIWSLVWGRLLGAFFKTVFSYWVHPYRPCFRIDWKQVRDLWNYGQWIFLGGLLSYFQIKGDQLFVGKMFGPAMLGLYVMASKLSQVSATEVTLVIAEVTFPAYSKLQDDIPRLKIAYLRVLQLTAFLMVPIGGMIFALSGDFVHAFMKPEWLPMIPVMQILAFKGIFQSLQSTFGAVYRATGKPGIHAYLQMIRLAFLAIFIYPLAHHWQLCGAAFTMVIVVLITLPIGYYQVIRILRCGVGPIVYPMVCPSIAAGIMVGAIQWGRRMFFDGRFHFGSLIGLGGGGLLVYLAVILMMERFRIYRIRPLLVGILGTIVHNRITADANESSGWVSDS